MNRSTDIVELLFAARDGHRVVQRRASSIQVACNKGSSRVQTYGQMIGDAIGLVVMLAVRRWFYRVAYQGERLDHTLRDSVFF